MDDGVETFRTGLSGQTNRKERAVMTVNRLPWSFMDTSAPGHFGTYNWRHLYLVPKCPGHFRTGAEVSKDTSTSTNVWRHFGTGTEMSQDTSAPFAQLFSVHAFIKKDGKLKQVPLAFVLVSRRRRKDYVRVLRTLMDVMPQRSAVQAVVSCGRQSVRCTVLPGVYHRGCTFHFCRALWPSIQGVGLQAAYMSDDAVNRVCR